MQGQRWTIGRIAGVEIRVHVSWLIIVWLVGLGFGARIDVLYDVSGTAMVALAIAATVALFASVLIHELAHAVVARRRGLRVEGITLFLFGGATEAELESKKPRDELVIAAVGPIMSLVLAAVLFGAATGLGDVDDAVPGTVGYLAWINLILAVFNMLPGFPLDGGRVFRAIAWSVTGDIGRATRLAAGGGRIVGYGLIAAGLLTVLGGGLGGLWIAAIGWFLSQAATATALEHETRTALEGVTVGELVSRTAATISPSAKVEDAAREYLRHDATVFLVSDDGTPDGVLRLSTVRDVPAGERSERSVREVMEPLSSFDSIDADEPAASVLTRIEGQDPIAVTDGGDVVALVSVEDLGRRVRRVAALRGDAT